MPNTHALDMRRIVHVIGQNMTITGNVGTGQKTVTSNTVTGNLECFRNALPFSGSGNVARRMDAVRKRDTISHRECSAILPYRPFALRAGATVKRKATSGDGDQGVAAPKIRLGAFIFKPGPFSSNSRAMSHFYYRRAAPAIWSG
jgi:hypothetical protein